MHRTSSMAAALFAVVVSAVSAQSIPSPESVLGFAVGDDFKLADYDESIAYFQALDAASDRIQLVEVGKTSEGRAWYMAVISSPSNLNSLDNILDMSRRLAHPADIDEPQARHIARIGKAIVHIDGGLHASEVAGAQHTIQLAYDLVSGADHDSEVQQILDDVVVLLWPSLNPDGQDIVVDWYRDNVGTPYEVAPLNQLYQKYIGHDNNRDAYMLNMVESRVLARTWRHWEPQIIFVHHQSSPFPTRIWLPPFAEPIATQAPPIMSRTVNFIGMAMAHRLESEGKVGAVHMGTGFDAWYPGYVDYLPMLQNIAAWWTETALYRYATPHFYTLQDFPARRSELRPESLYPSPWPGGWWRLKDAVDYMGTASMATLRYASEYREDLLFNRYQSGRGVIEKYRSAPPYAWFVPQDQHDPASAPDLLKRLAFQGIRIAQLDSTVEHEGMTFDAGTWVIPMDQEFAEYARQILDVQVYPDLREFPDGPPEQPYDAAGWTLPYQMNVHMIAATQPLSEEVLNVMSPVRGDPEAWEPGASEPLGFDTDSIAAGVTMPEGRITGSGGAYHLDPRQNASFAALNRALTAGATVRYRQSDNGGVFAVSSVASSNMTEWATELHLHVTRGSANGDAPVRRRIGLYRPWAASMDEGWTRWLFEEHEFEFSNIRNTELRAGDLDARYDVILIAADRPGTILNGFTAGTVPPRYAGGIGTEGVRALDTFVRAGGTLVTFNQASDFAIDMLHLPVENVVRGLPRDEFFVSGSLLEVEADLSHPVMAGMPARAKIFVDRSPVFTVTEGFEGTALLKYGQNGTPLLSGYLLGEERLQGLAAALDVRHGEGRVILIGFRPQWRGQPRGTFRIVFNAALYGGELGEVRGSPEFWTAPEPESEEETNRR